MGREVISFSEEDISHVVKILRKGLANTIVPDKIRGILTGQCLELEEYWVPEGERVSVTDELKRKIQEECASWVCSLCANENGRWGLVHLEDGYWVHRPLDPEHSDNLRKCDAEEIWEQLGGPHEP